MSKHGTVWRLRGGEWRHAITGGSQWIIRQRAPRCFVLERARFSQTGYSTQAVSATLEGAKEAYARLTTLAQDARCDVGLGANGVRAMKTRLGRIRYRHADRAWSSQRIMAVVLGRLAVHRSVGASDYTLTHIPTGAAIAFFDGEAEALDAAVLLDATANQRKLASRKIDVASRAWPEDIVDALPRKKWVIAWAS